MRRALASGEFVTRKKLRLSSRTNKQKCTPSMDVAPGRLSFPTTRWTFILTLRNRSDPACVREALAALCRDYWAPLYVFARRKGETEEDAKDLTQ